MFELLMIGLLGTALFSFMDFGDNEEEEPEDNYLDFDGSDVLYGTNGADYLLDDQDDTLSPREVYLLDGDDFAEIDEPRNDAYAPRIYGGQGDDFIESTATWVTIYGDEGDDTLEVAQGSQAYGGEGNDILTFNNIGYSDIGTILYGGDGDDFFVHSSSTVFELGEPGNLATHVGGEGNDTFDIIIRTTPTSYNETTDGLNVLYTQHGTVHTFIPSEDTLNITLERNYEALEREPEISLTSRDVGDGFYSSIFEITFEETETELRHRAVVNIHSVGEITLDDINFTDEVGGVA